MKHIYYDKSWDFIFDDQLPQPYFQKLVNILEKEYEENIIHPPKEHIFNAFKLTPFNEIKVVIIGQDPYHGENQAMGLSFSVNSTCKIPPSLRNIYKEIESDLNIKPPINGDLTFLAKQGVFLLNSVLTVENGKANSHQKIGWELFTDYVIKQISLHHSSVVFILWGANAQKKSVLIDENKHVILSSVHPSPLSSYRGFFGSKPFSKTNDFLITPINWTD